VSAAFQLIARDPIAALERLDEYTRRFPRGALADEAAMARVETLIALGHRHQALPVLDRLIAGRHPRARSLRATRGVLLAQLQRCPEARADFDAILATGDHDEAAERALWGRAACHARLDEPRAFLDDLHLYLRRFPDGRHADEARRSLAADAPP
jgi:hypothetical protein